MSVERTLELEIGSELSENDFEKLLGFFLGNGNIQHNHYADTPNLFLYNSGITLRVRKKECSQKLQIKIPFTSGGKEEVQYSLSDEECGAFLNRSGAFEYPEEFQEALFTYARFKNIQQLIYLGTVTTHRRVVHVPKIDGEWALDKSTYPSGRVDYRIELEHGKNFKTEAQTMLINLLVHYGIEHKPLTVSKFQRLVQDLQKHTDHEAAN